MELYSSKKYVYCNVNRIVNHLLNMYLHYIGASSMLPALIEYVITAYVSPPSSYTPVLNRSIFFLSKLDDITAGMLITYHFYKIPRNVCYSVD